MAYGLTHYRSPRVAFHAKPSFRIGDLVCDAADERHVGEVRAIVSRIHIVVRWQETGWRSVINANRLRRPPDE
jgi:hypothetical protein